jgi:hypothetical protein
MDKSLESVRNTEKAPKLEIGNLRKKWLSIIRKTLKGKKPQGRKSSVKEIIL